MEYFNAATVPSEERSKESAIVKMKINEYDAYIISDDEFWCTEFYLNGEYVKSGLCTSTIGACVDYLFNSKIEVITELESD